MPVRPENVARYPANWPEIALAIKVAAGWRCEGSPVYPDCRAAHDEQHPATGANVVLTVGHLNHQPEDCRRENLRAWCQRCHNTYDRAHRLTTAATTLAQGLRAAGQRTFEEIVNAEAR